MTLYAIVLTEPNAEVDARIRGKYTTDRELYDKLNDTFYLVRSDSIYSEEVAVNVGIKGYDRVKNAKGVVFRLNGVTYSGYAPGSIWEWLSLEG